MKFTEEELQEFKVEAEELLDNAEKSLLELDRGGEFSKHYDSIFRAFHSIKGAAGMMELTELQSHMHQLENIFTEKKKGNTLDKKYIDFFLLGSDGARKLLQGQSIQFKYDIETVAAPSKEAAVETSAKLPPPPPVRQPPGKVVIVDDEPEIVNILTQIVSEEGFEVHGVNDAEEAIAVIHRVMPDVILSDINMPKMTGLEMVKELSKTVPEIPVILISAHLDKSSLLQAISNGIYAVIEKPFDSKKVLETAINGVRKHRLSKLLNQSINLIMYQFTDLDEFLISQGKTDISNTIRKEIESIIAQRRNLKQLDRK